MRVKVWNGDKSRYLGEGDMTQNSVVYVVVQPDGSLRSMKDASQYPDRDMEITGTVKRVENNPVIHLDAGQTVYGCQTWWSEVSKVSKAPTGPPQYTNEEPDIAKMLKLAEESVAKYREN